MLSYLRRYRYLPEDQFGILFRVETAMRPEVIANLIPQLDFVALGHDCNSPKVAFTLRVPFVIQPSKQVPIEWNCYVC